MDCEQILSAINANASANEECDEIDETTPLLGNGSRPDSDRVSSIGTGGQQNNKRHVCCIYITGFLSFAIFFALIFGLRFGPDLEISLNQDTQYGDALSGILITVVVIGVSDQLCLVICILYAKRCRGSVMFSIERVFFLILGFSTTGSFLVDALTTRGLCYTSYNGLCCVFATLQIFYHCSNDSNSLPTNKYTGIAFILLIAVNLCIWSDTEINEIYIIFHESDIFNSTLVDTNMSLSTLEKSQGASTIDSLFDDIAHTIHPYATPLKIEFFLMALELLASKIDQFDSQEQEQNLWQHNVSTNETMEINSHGSSIVKKLMKLPLYARAILNKITSLKTFEFAVKGVYCTLVSLFALVSVLMVVVAANPDETTMSSFYRFYNRGDLTFDILQFLFLSMTLLATYPWRSDINMHLDNIVFSICAFANILYNFFDSYSSFYIGEYAGGLNGVLTITNTFVQTIYLIILHDGQHDENGQSGIKLLFYLLSINNLGFWMVDSLAQARYPPFTYSLKSFYNDTWWKIFNKIVFPFVIFYRFKAALFFFESWCSKEETTDLQSRELSALIEGTSMTDNETRTRRQRSYDEC